MSEDTAPTLKIRVKMPDDISHLGRDCTAVARGLVIPPYTVLDSKWSRPEDKWIADGRDWGKARLTERERGFVDAMESLDNRPEVEARLVAIIRRISR